MMKRLTCVVLMLCVALMCTTPFEAQGQGRRGPSHSGSHSHSTAVSHSRSSSGSHHRSAPASAPRSSVGSSHRGGAVASHRSAPSTRQSGPSYSPQRNHRPTASVGRSRDMRPSAGPGRSRDMRPAPGRSRDMRPMASHHRSVRPPVAHRPYRASLFGHRVSYLPHGYVVRHIGGRPYYYYDGIYYRPYRYGGYYVCRPPLGTVFAATLFDAAMTAASPVFISSVRWPICWPSVTAAGWPGCWCRCLCWRWWCRC